MADGKDDDWLKLPTIGVVALVAAVAGHIWKSPVPYVDERPGAAAAPTQRQLAAQDVEARLWQDPFSIKPETPASDASLAFSVRSADGKGRALRINAAPGGGDEHGKDRVYLSKSVCRLTVIAALLPGGRYPEDVEVRQRQRYALLSALAVRGFAPADAEHLGFFVPDMPQGADSARGRRVWFEWFTGRNNEEQSTCGGTASQALVLWVNSASLGETPLANIVGILKQAAPPDDRRLANATTNYAVIGPNDSGQLATLAKEAFARKTLPFDDVITPEQLIFFPATATAPDSVLLKEVAHCSTASLSACLFTKKIRLMRTTPDDASLSRALVEELKLRQVNPSRDHIFVLSEWDSLYGREIPDTFRKVYQGSARPPDPEHDRVHQVSYVRGIDGKLPGTPDTADKTDARPANDKKGSADAPHSAIERPEGPSQKDYLRRLVERVFEEERRIQNIDCPFTKKCGIAAIGVLGYDTYDKLMLLQALRPRFPGKIFFTTDLDALYLHPNESPYTHNLVVASGFDLRLRDELQGDIPPFRDSGQTAVFLSGLLAMQGMTANNDPPGYKLNPVIFEIGHRQQVPLGLKDFPFGATADRCTPKALGKCGNFQPPPPQRWPREQFLLLTLALIVGAGLASRISWTVRGWLLHHYVLPIPRLRPRVNGWVIVFGIAILVALVAACPYFSGLDGEPFYWANGVSIWPSEILRLLALVISLVMLSQAWKEIETDRSGRQEGYRARTGYLAGLQLSLECISTGWRPPRSVCEWHEPARPDGEVDVAALLFEYHVMGSREQRRHRVAVNFAWFIAVFVLITLLWGMPHSPTRGGLAYWINLVATLSAAAAFVYLTVWIVDAARLCQRMIRHLARAPSRWPDSSLTYFAAKLGMRAEDGVADWLDMKFVGRHTAVVQKLIWYPIVPALLMIFARNTIFDDWDFPLSLIVTLALTIGYAFSCLFLLQSCAKEARVKAVGHLTELLDHLRGNAQPGDERRIAQIEELRSRVASMKDGAFQPLPEQPMFKALLTLLGGGGLAMTDLLSFMG